MSVSAVTVLTFPAGDPCPHALVQVTGIVGSSITLYRTWEGQSTVVRGAYQAAVLGSVMEFWDWEAPFGVPVTYRAEVVQSGATAMAQSGAATLAVEHVWISDPLSPRVSMAVELVDSLAERGYDRAGSIVSVIGDSTPIAMLGVRQEASAVPLVIRSRTLMSRLSALSILRSTDPLLVRIPALLPFAGIPSLAYVTAPRIVDRPLNPGLGLEDSRLEMSATLVRAPAANVVRPPRNYGMARDEAGTYTASRLLYPSYTLARRGGA